MNTITLLEPTRWAKETFGGSKLGDVRRSQRVIKLASSLAENPQSSIPAQLQSWKESKAMYRLLHEEDVTFAALMQPHWQQTQKLMETVPLVLLVQDFSDLDFSHRPKMAGLGQIGNEKGRGLRLQTVLAIDPASKNVLGCRYQCPFVRVPAPIGESRAQRSKRPKETDAWWQAVDLIGTPSSGSQFLHVGDRETESFAFFHHCFQHHTHFLVRAVHERRLLGQDGSIKHFFPTMASLPNQDERCLEIPASGKRKARTGRFQLAWTALTLLPPRNDSRLNKLEPLSLWGLRLWEVDPPEGEEPLEWLLFTSMEITTSQQAWQTVSYYQQRWIIEIV